MLTFMLIWKLDNHMLWHLDQVISKSSCLYTCFMMPILGPICLVKNRHTLIVCIIKPYKISELKLLHVSWSSHCYPISFVHWISGVPALFVFLPCFSSTCCKGGRGWCMGTNNIPSFLIRKRHPAIKQYMENNNIPSATHLLHRYFKR